MAAVAVQDEFVKDVSQVAKTGQAVKVRVMSVEGNRISLTMKSGRSEDAATASVGADGERPRLGKVATRAGEFPLHFCPLPMMSVVQVKCSDPFPTCLLCWHTDA